MRALSIFFILIASLSPSHLQAQVKAELVYPVVPVADDCHFVFDDTSSIRIVERIEFLKWDKLFSTENKCFGLIEDTIFFKEYNVAFTNMVQGRNSVYYVFDGRLQSQYQSSLKAAMENVQPYTEVIFSDIKYEKGGAMYQIAPFTVIIDSILEPKLDNCWTPIPREGGYNLVTSKQEIISLFKDSLGYDRCTGKLEWIDTTSPLEVYIVPTEVLGDRRVFNEYIQYKVLPSKNSELLESLDSINEGDRVEIRNRSYIKNREYYYSERYIIRILEDKPCQYIFHPIEDSVSVLKEIIDNIRESKKYTPFCVSSEMADGRYTFVFSYKDKSLVSTSTGSKKLSYDLWLRIKRMKKGDRLVLESKVSGIYSDSVVVEVE